jgi:integrase
MGRPLNSIKNSKPILEKEYKLLLAYVNGSIKNNGIKEKWLNTIELLYMSGLRITEILSIKCADIENAIGSGELKVYISKQNIYRHIPLSDKSVRILKNMTANNSDSESFIIHKRNRLFTTLNSASFTYEFNVLIKNALNSDDYSSHSFRKGLITQMSQCGVNPKITQTFIGHRNVTTTLNYYKPTQSDIKLSLVR